MSACSVAIAVASEQLEPAPIEAPSVHLAEDVADAARKLGVGALLAEAHLQVAMPMARDEATRGGGALAPVLAVFLLEHRARPEIAQRRQAKRLLHLGGCGLVDEDPRPDLHALRSLGMPDAQRLHLRQVGHR